MKRAHLFLAFASAVAASAVAAWFFPTAKPVSPLVPTETGKLTFVGSKACIGCHAQEGERWEASDHAKALFTPKTNPIHPNVSNIAIPQLADGARFTEDDRGIHVEVPNGSSVDRYDIAYAIGVRPLQQLVAQMPNGHLQSLTIAWNVEKKEWYSLYPAVLGPKDALHFSQPTQNFSSMCGDCHTTGYEKNFDLQARAYNTQWKEIGVGCEQCHGPGSRHVAWAHSKEKADASKGLALRGRDLSAESLVEACAQCHSQRRPLTKTHEVGKPFFDQYQPLLLDEGQYYADGQIEGEVYEYGSFLQSKMFSRGVKCTDCHNVHSGKLIAEGNSLCVQCHSETPPARFNTLVKKLYDSPEHHKHATGSQGALCVNCHMRDRTYMGIDARRDHSFRIPRPVAGSSLSLPDACSNCHKKEGSAWATKAVERLWGAHPDRYDFASTFAAARRGSLDAANDLVRLLNDPAQPAIVRATAIRLYGTLGVDNPFDALEAGARDAHALVRFATAGALPAIGRGSTAQRFVKILSKLIADPTKLVRAEAGRVAAGVPHAMWSPSDRVALAKARADFVERERANEERPDAHVTLAIDAELTSDIARAKKEYELALELSPSFVPAHLNLATMLAREKNLADAELHLKEAIASEPNSGAAHYALALVLVETKRTSAAIDELRRASELMPRPVRVLYTLGLLLDKEGKQKDALVALKRASDLDARDADVLYALAFSHASHNQKDDAKKWLEKLRAAHPNDRRLKALSDQLAK